MCKNSTTAIQLSQMVSANNVRGAENMLMSIADQPDGDTQILTIIEKLPSADLSAIVREFDIGSPSILHHFITPKQFGSMLRIEDRYGSKQSVAGSHAHGMISAIVFGENIDPHVTPADFLREACATEEGMKELVNFALFTGGGDDDENRRHDQILHFMESGTFDIESEEPDDPLSNHDMAWRQMIQTIRNELPDESELFLIALGDYKNKWNVASTIPGNQPVAASESAL